VNSSHCLPLREDFGCAPVRIDDTIGVYAGMAMRLSGARVCYGMEVTSGVQRVRDIWKEGDVGCFS